MWGQCFGNGILTVIFFCLGWKDKISFWQIQGLRQSLAFVQLLIILLGEITWILTKSSLQLVPSGKNHPSGKNCQTPEDRQPAWNSWNSLLRSERNETNVPVIPLPVLRYFILRSSSNIRSFLLVSVSLFRLNSSRRETVTFVLFDVPDDRYRILVNAYFQAWSIHFLVIHQFSSTD